MTETTVDELRSGPMCPACRRNVTRVDSWEADEVKVYVCPFDDCRAILFGIEKPKIIVAGPDALAVPRRLPQMPILPGREPSRAN